MPTAESIQGGRAKKMGGIEPQNRQTLPPSGESIGLRNRRLLVRAQRGVVESIAGRNRRAGRAGKQTALTNSVQRGGVR